MMECAKVKRSLSRYLDQETGDVESSLIKAHLNTCPGCKQELAQLSRAKNLVCAKQRKTLPEDYLVARLREEIASQKQPQEQDLWLVGMGRLSRRLIPVPVALIALSIVFLAVTSIQPTSKHSLADHMLSGEQTTTETALGLILGNIKL